MLGITSFLPIPVRTGLESKNKAFPLRVNIDAGWELPFFFLGTQKRSLLLKEWGRTNSSFLSKREFAFFF